MAERRESPNRGLQIEAEMRRQAARHERLKPDEEAALLARHDPDAVEALVRHNLDLVVSQAEAHADQGLGFADLYQEGTVGLLDAVSAYQGQGQFREFASLHIGLQMDSLLEAEGAARRRAAAHVADCRALDLAQAAFLQEHRRAPSGAEMAQALGWDMERLRRVAATLDHARSENDVATLSVLEDADLEELGVDFEPDEEDHRRRPAGAGPDD